MFCTPAFGTNQGKNSSRREEDNTGVPAQAIAARKKGKGMRTCREQEGAWEGKKFIDLSDDNALKKRKRKRGVLTQGRTHPLYCLHRKGKTTY